MGPLVVIDIFLKVKNPSFMLLSEFYSLLLSYWSYQLEGKGAVFIYCIINNHLEAGYIWYIKKKCRFDFLGGIQYFKHDN